MLPECPPFVKVLPRLAGLHLFKLPLQVGPNRTLSLDRSWDSPRLVLTCGCPRNDGTPSIPPWTGRTVTQTRGKDVAKSPSATCLEATGELNISGVVNSPRTWAGMGCQGISPPHRGSSPISLGSGPRQGNLPPGDDPHEGESGWRAPRFFRFRPARRGGGRASEKQASPGPRFFRETSLARVPLLPISSGSQGRWPGF